MAQWRARTWASIREAARWSFPIAFLFVCVAWPLSFWREVRVDLYLPQHVEDGVQWRHLQVRAASGHFQLSWYVGLPMAPDGATWPTVRVGSGAAAPAPSVAGPGWGDSLFGSSNSGIAAWYDASWNVAGISKIILIPHWFPAGALVGPALLIALRAWRHRKRFKDGQCSGCGYELDGLLQGAPCPECGARDTRSLGKP